MELKLTYKDKDNLIEGIAKYYSVNDILSLGRNLEINEADYYNKMITARELAESFISRVFQMSKENELLQLIENHSSLNRKIILTEITKTDVAKDEMKDGGLNILHLSDIHLGTLKEARNYKLQINTDLYRALKIEKIDFIIISGDIAHLSTQVEYEAAVELVEGIMSKFKVDSDRIIIVPGNHDLDWNISKKSVISGSSDDNIEFDQNIYKQRFDNFNNFFYKAIVKKDYPSNYDEQGILYEYEKEKIIFLALNSAWEIDHINKYRSSIFLNSLDKPLDELMDKKYDDWLKIAVFHHSVKGKNCINNEFLDILIRNGFKICMHGHIHEAAYDFSSYGCNKKIAIIGAGTFGAPDEEHVVGVPLQYNFIRLGIDNIKIRVNTRRKEKTEGAWEADARWGDKEKPDAFYDIDLSKLN